MVHKAVSRSRKVQRDSSDGLLPDMVIWSLQRPRAAQHIVCSLFQKETQMETKASSFTCG